ncbi:MAG: aminotransferase class I/II-fold pyridoxal phosphate-dependent enzyme [Cohaesibacter sp.]|jgi:UDP-4-amino-4-deoxy-L-arabinose-oxoglutarate aminotransferase|nr:aminotransferase class I/II-fold pyridoxal phosphate-dependent enzyme [Cohaesibacter sp.]
MSLEGQQRHLFPSQSQPRADERLSGLFSGAFIQYSQDWSTAIQACLLVKGIGQGDEVILPALAPASLAHAVELVGARPVFVDVDADTLLISFRAIERALSDKSRAVLVCHLFGQIYNSAPLYELLSAHNIALIEDGSDAMLSLVGRAPISLDHCDFLVSCLPSGREEEAPAPAFIATSNEGEATKLARWAEQQSLQGVAFLRESAAPLVGLVEEPTADQELLLQEGLDQAPTNHQALHKQISTYRMAFAASPLRLVCSSGQGQHNQTAMPVHVPYALRQHCFDSLVEAGFHVYQSYRSLPELSYFKRKYRPQSCPNAYRWAQGAFSLPTGHLLGSREQIILMEHMRQKIFPAILDAM